MVLVPLRASRSLSICGLEYRVVFATSEEVPALEANEGYTSCETNTIYLASNIPRSRMRDALVHEVCHAFLEASGVGSFLQTSLKDKAAYDDFEETLIRVLVPHVLRLVLENGKALIEVPRAQRGATRATAKAKAKHRSKAKKAKR